MAVLPARAQFTCTWSQSSFDGFEYSTATPGILPNTVYSSGVHVPEALTQVAHSGNRGLYLNFVDGFSGMFYDRTYSLCPGSRYRFSFWTKDTWGGTNNLTFQVVDANNTVLSTQNVINNGTWQLVTMPEFVATTGNIRFRGSTNIPGGGGNDAAFDDLTLEICNSTHDLSATPCALAGASVDLYDLLPSPSNTGTWSGISATTNGYRGTFVQGSNTNGLYTYTVDGGTCADSLFRLEVQVVFPPQIVLPNKTVFSCGPYTLPDLTANVTNIDPMTLGTIGYFTGPGGSGLEIPVGATINTSQTLYLQVTATNCQDEDTLKINIVPRPSAGTDRNGYYCNPGMALDVDNFLSAGTATGTWTETTNPASGTFVPGSGQWNTASLSPGVYTFRYLVPASAPCPADTALLTIQMGNMKLDLGNDTAFCNGQPLTLNAGAGYDIYKWNDGDNTATKQINAAGTYWVSGSSLGPNQITNGDFEQGNTAFSTQYTVGNGGASGLLSNESTYAVVLSPSSVHNQFTACTDHTPGAGNQQMVVNGAATPNINVWCQTLVVQPNTDYRFSTWITSVIQSTAVAQLQFSINNVPLGSVFSPPTSPCNWVQFAESWQSGPLTNVEICIVNQSTVVNGNDFALDDISFSPVCISSDTIVVEEKSATANFSHKMECLQKVDFSGTSPAGSQTTWDFGDGASASGENVSHTYTDAGNYTVTYTAQTPDGCTATQSQAVEVTPSAIKPPESIPNIITPDGNGMNDQIDFGDKQDDCVKYDVVIYNRWGAPVFSQKNGTAPFEGKNGAGAKLSAGVYFYVLKVGDTKMNGTITLVR